MCINDSRHTGNDGASELASGMQRWRQLLDAAPDLRMDRVIRIRSQIGDGSYDEQAGLDTMIDRMSNDLAGIRRG